MKHSIYFLSNENNWIYYVLLLIAMSPCSLQADDNAHQEAANALSELGGSVRRVASNSQDYQVDFSLGGRDVTGNDFAHLARLNNVVALNLKGTKITSADMSHLKSLTKLRELHLEMTEVGDEGMVHLQGLTELEYLNLFATNVTDQSLKQLVGLKKLKRLYLWQTDVSDEAVADLEEALPELSIVRGASLDAGSSARKRIVTSEAKLPRAGQPWKLTGIRYEDGSPGAQAQGKIYFREQGTTDFTSADLTRDSQGQFEATIPGEATGKTFQYYVRIREPKQAPSTYPAAGGKEPAEAIPDVALPMLAEAPRAESAKSYAVALAWKAATDDRGIASYAVYRGKDRDSVANKDNLLAELKPDQLTHQDDKPPAGETVFYAVQPVDVAGRAGAARLLEVNVPKDLPPTNDLKLAASAGSKAVVIDWSGEIEPDVKQILVFRSDSPDGQPKQIAELQLADATNWIDKDVRDDTDYRYFIKLRDAGGLTSAAGGEVIAKAGGYLRRINCGGPELPSPDGAPWEADNGSVAGTGRFTAKSLIANPPESLQDVYQTERWSYRGVRYRFNASPGTYRVTLHLAETNNAFAAEGKRTFNVVINDETVHEAVDVFAKAGKATAWQLTTDIEHEGDEIVIELRKVAAGPAIKGLEVREIAKAQESP